MIRRLILALVALAYATSASAALPGANGYQGSDVVDARAYGAKCANNSSEDDAAALSAAYAKLSATGGGTIVLRGTCYVASDVQVEDNVALVCEPGAGIKATVGGSYTLGLLRWVDGALANQNNTSIRGCTFDLNGHAKPAMQISGAGNTVSGVTIQNGDASASAYSLVTWACTGGKCRFADSIINCAATAGANDTGIAASGTSATVAAVIENNTVVGCETAGISTTAGHVIRGNAVSSSVASAVGILVTGNSAKVESNAITMSGTTSTGAILDDLTVFAGNSLDMSASTGGTEAQVAIKAAGLGARIEGNTSFFAVDEGNWHVKIAAQQTRVLGNYFLNGKYGVAPDNSSDATLEINAYVTGNEIWGINGSGSVGIVMNTGWMVQNNYVSWNGYIGASIGDARGTQKAIANHAAIIGNRFHTFDSTGQGIVFANVGNLCDSGDKKGQSCSTDDTNGTTGCPNATACPGCCDATGYDNIIISGNEFLYLAATGPVIDFANAITASTSSTIKNITIDGSIFDLSASEYAIAFPSSNQSLVTNVTIGDASFDGYTGQGLPISNLTSAMANLTMYPAIVADLPAANCVAATAVSFWNQPSSTAPNPLCLGTTYARGALNFDKTADETIYTDLLLPPKWTGWLYADIWWSTSDTAANRDVVWGVQGVCIAPGENYDPSFSSTAQTVTSPAVQTFADYAVKATINLSNASNNPLNTCAAGEQFNLKLYRDADNGSDDADADARLWRVVLRQW